MNIDTYNIDAVLFQKNDGSNLRLTRFRKFLHNSKWPPLEIENKFIYTPGAASRRAVILGST